MYFRLQKLFLPTQTESGGVIVQAQLLWPNKEGFEAKEKASDNNRTSLE
jgi:hypothetical protein